MSRDNDEKEKSQGGEGLVPKVAAQRRKGFYVTQLDVTKLVLPKLYPEGSKCKSVQEIK